MAARVLFTCTLPASASKHSMNSDFDTKGGGGLADFYRLKGGFPESFRIRVEKAEWPQQFQGVRGESQ